MDDPLHPTPQAQRLENLAARHETRVLNPAYSLLVRRLRLVLPLLAVMIVAAVFTWGLLDRNTVIEKTDPKDTMDKAQNELLAAHFESVDEEGRPFLITARKAAQGKPEDGQDQKMIYLDDPEGQYSISEEETLKIAAPKGAYHQQKQTLVLAGGVRFQSSGGYALETNTVEADIKEGTASSDSPLTGEGPSGSLSAQGFTADNKRGTLVLLGPARMILKPEAL